MTLTDLITPQDDLHELMHRVDPFPTDDAMRAKMQRVAHIRETFYKCVKECGQVNAKLTVDEEVAIMLSTFLVLDDAVEYLTTHKKAS